MPGLGLASVGFGNQAVVPDPALLPNSFRITLALYHTRLRAYSVPVLNHIVYGAHDGILVHFSALCQALICSLALHTCWICTKPCVRAYEFEAEGLGFGV